MFQPKRSAGAWFRHGVMAVAAWAAVTEPVGQE